MGEASRRKALSVTSIRALLGEPDALEEAEIALEDPPVGYAPWLHHVLAHGAARAGQEARAQVHRERLAEVAPYFGGPYDGPQRAPIPLDELVVRLGRPAITGLPRKRVLVLAIAVIAVLLLALEGLERLLGP
jgi:plasmid stabilization system protein ParE